VKARWIRPALAVLAALGLAAAGCGGNDDLPDVATSAEDVQEDAYEEGRQLRQEIADRLDRAATQLAQLEAGVQGDNEVIERQRQMVRDEIDDLRERLEETGVESEAALREIAEQAEELAQDLEREIREVSRRDL